MAHNDTCPVPTGVLSGSPFHNKEYKQSKQLGEGSYGVVYKAVHQASGTEVAIKEFACNKGREYVKEAMEHEYNVMTELHRAAPGHVVRIYAMYYNPRTKRGYLVMELLSDSLAADMEARQTSNTRHTYAEALQLILYIFEALAAIHAAGYAHGDLKPANLGFRGSKIVLIDGGSVVKIDGERQAGSVLCTREYAAPEVLAESSRPATHKVDVWSAGIIAYELLSGQDASDAQGAWARLHERCGMRPAASKPNLRKMPKDAAKLLRKALRRSPAKRISAADALKHTVFASVVPRAAAAAECEAEAPVADAAGAETPATVAVFIKPLPENVAGALLQLATDFDFAKLLLAEAATTIPPAAEPTASAETACAVEKQASLASLVSDTPTSHKRRSRGDRLVGDLKAAVRTMARHMKMQRDVAAV